MFPVGDGKDPPSGSELRHAGSLHPLSPAIWESFAPSCAFSGSLHHWA